MRQVTAPDGTVHVVRIEWIGNRIRRAPSDLRERIGRGRKRTGKVVDAGEDVPSGCIPIPDEFALVAIVMVAVLLFFVFVTPLLAGLIELLALALIAFGVWGFSDPLPDGRGASCTRPPTDPSSDAWSSAGDGRSGS